MSNKRTLSRQNGMIAGVCGGLAERFGISPLLVRIAFLLLLIPGGISPVIYLILWFVMPNGE